MWGHAQAWPSLLAGRTDSKKLQTVRDRRELAPHRDPLLQFADHTITDLHKAGALRANQMVLMAMMPLVKQRKPGHAVAKVKPLYHPKALQQLNRAINCRQITIALGQPMENFLARKRSWLVPEHPQDCPARAGDLAGFPAEPIVQAGRSALPAC
jgi:hypothetical protein